MTPDIADRIMFGIFLDVTQRKQAEEANELLAGEMGHRVKEPSRDSHGAYANHVALDRNQGGDGTSRFDARASWLWDRAQGLIRLCSLVSNAKPPSLGP